ncbi:MAG: helix-turn-helix domain-containing protein, partial [Methylocystis sp.]
MRERRRLVERKLPLATVATGVGISERTARKWAKRFEAEGPAGLENRFSRPRMVANRTGEPCLAHRNPPVSAPGQVGRGLLAAGFLAQRLASAATAALRGSGSKTFGSNSSPGHSRIS